MKYRVLTESQVEQFMECGWTKLEEAFPRKHALEAQNVVWQNVEKRGVLKNDRSTWTEPKVQLNETYDTPEFRACNTERLADAIEDLVGSGRWAYRGRHAGWGWWPVNFAVGADRPWDVPTSGWHYDGIHFRHYVDSPEQGLLLLCLFSDVGPRGGGTLVAEGSHNIVARMLAEHPEGLELGEAIRIANRHPWLAELTGSGAGQGPSNGIYAEEARDAGSPDGNRIRTFMETAYRDPQGYSLKVVETTGSAGDAILCHPFLYHAASQNHSGQPRFMCNRTTPLKERMNLRREHPEDHSPLEMSIRRAIV